MKILKPNPIRNDNGCTPVCIDEESETVMLAMHDVLCGRN